MDRRKLLFSVINDKNWSLKIMRTSNAVPANAMLKKSEWIKDIDWGDTLMLVLPY